MNGHAERTPSCSTQPLSLRSPSTRSFSTRSFSTRSFPAMGTTWWLHSDVEGPLEGAEALVHVLEARLSRFRTDSALSALNRDRRAECATLAEVTRIALHYKQRTHGAFDPTLGAAMHAVGYTRGFPWSEPCAEVNAAGCVGHMDVQLEGDTVTLDGVGELDLGGIAKGYAVDRVVEWLRAAGATEALVDGGGDLRGFGGPFPIGVGDGLVVSSGAGAIATSSTCRRRWLHTDGRTSHHIIDPVTERSVDSTVDTATVVASSAVEADVLATAVIVRPSSMLGLLQSFGAHALVRDTQQRWWSTAAMPLGWEPHHATLSQCDPREHVR